MSLKDFAQTFLRSFHTCLKNRLIDFTELKSDDNKDVNERVTFPFNWSEPA